MSDSETKTVHPSTLSARRFADSGTILLLLSLAVTFLILATWTGGSSESVAVPGLTALGRASISVAVWLLAAAGYGAWVLRMLPQALTEGTGPGQRLLLAFGLGTPILLWLASSLGSLGLLDMFMAWGILVLGMILLVMVIRNSSRRRAIGASEGWLPPLSWTAGPALAVLLLASVSAPGWLWQTEFGGYDALSYHLQLPREWLVAGKIFTPTWNVYGALPSFVEAGYFQLMVMERNPVATAFSAQLLHASFAILTAASTGAAIGRWLDAGRVGAGFALLLGTPWVIVVGSLAYDEMVAAFMLATAMLLFVPRQDAPLLRGPRGRIAAGCAAGLLAGGACAAKLTAVGFVAMPIAYLLIRRVRTPGWRDALPIAALTGFVVLLPWLARNFAATGNPTFPFGSDLFGSGHFSNEQINRFLGAHVSSEGLPGRLTQFRDQILRYGIGPNPVESEPWRAQWSILPALTAIGLIVGFCRRSTRRIARDLLILVLIPCVFWIAATHLKSRFLVPAIPALIASATLLLPNGLMRDSTRSMGWRIPVAVFLFAWCLVPVWLFRTEQMVGSSPAAAAMVDRLDLVTGITPASAVQNEPDPEKKVEILSMTGPNTLLALLPPEEKILALGNATPFLAPRRFEYTTVWDDNPISKLMRQHPDDPDAVIDALRDRGITLLLVDRRMLEIWARSGWLDTHLEYHKLAPVIEKLQPEFAWQTGELLLRIPPEESP